MDYITIFRKLEGGKAEICIYSLYVFMNRFHNFVNLVNDNKKGVRLKKI